MPNGSIVLGIDLLPIRAIRNVKTIVADITTAECRRQVTQELHGWNADVVLCDGAPNIGSAYQKDAYVQNELVLAALKTATEHLVQGGTFCTKVYRSKDYNALMWVLQQFFVDVQAMKPNSSRSQSAEIFLVCLQYLAPSTIDPKLLDPNHVFKEVADPSSNKTVDVLHKKYDLHNKRHRSGYDEEAGILLSKSCTVSQFVHSKDPVRLLTDMNSLQFTDECKAAYESHPATNSDILASFADLKVLGRIDFKKLLKWRLLMIKEAKGAETTQIKEISLEGEEDASASRARRPRDAPLTEDEIQEEILKRRERMERETRKQKKHNRLQAAKERKRQALGMNSDSFGVQDDMELFSLADQYEGGAANSRTMADLEGIRDVDLEGLDSDFDKLSDSDEDDGRDNFGLLELDDDGLEDELEAEYLRFAKRNRVRKTLHSKENMEDDIREGVYDAAITTKKAKRLATSESIVAQREQEDQDDFEEGEGGVEADLQRYVGMLSGKKVKATKVVNRSDSEDEDEDESDSEEDEDEEEQARPAKKQRGTKDKTTEDEDDVLLNTRDRLSVSAKASKWFSNPIFKESVVTSSGAVATPAGQKKRGKAEPVEEASDNEEAALENLRNLDMPLTDKQLRQQKRKKDMDKKARKEEKRSRALLSLGDAADGMTGGVFTSGIEIAPADLDEDDGLDLDDETIKMRNLIKQGMGKAGRNKDPNASKPFEIAPAVTMNSDDEYADGSDYDEDDTINGISRSSIEFTGENMDPRSYGSDEEVYDNRDRAMTLALGTMMLRKSRKKALVDASYNRYAWNDPKDLPSWFMDDEMRHNRPQLPVPNALLEQVLHLRLLTLNCMCNIASFVVCR